MSVQGVNPLTHWPCYCVTVPVAPPTTRREAFLQAMAAPARPLAQAEAFAGKNVFVGFNDKLAKALNVAVSPIEEID